MIETRTRLNWRYLLDYLVVAVFLSVLAQHVAAGDLAVYRFLALFAALWTARLVVPGDLMRSEVVT